MSSLCFLPHLLRSALVLPGPSTARLLRSIITRQRWSNSLGSRLANTQTNITLVYTATFSLILNGMQINQWKENCCNTGFWLRKVDKEFEVSTAVWKTDKIEQCREMLAKKRRREWSVRWMTDVSLWYTKETRPYFTSKVNGGKLLTWTRQITLLPWTVDNTDSTFSGLGHLASAVSPGIIFCFPSSFYAYTTFDSNPFSFVILDYLPILLFTVLKLTWLRNKSQEVNLI